MNIKIVQYIFFAFLVLLPAEAMAKGQLYKIDNDQTHVRFASKMCEADLLLGEFAKVGGEIYFDENDPSKSYANIEIDPSSAGFNKEYHGEDHIETIVKGKKFLNIVNFPKIKFKTTKLEKTSDTTANITGEMSLVGIEHPLTLEVTFHQDRGGEKGDRHFVAFSGYGKFKRSDHGIMYALDRIGIRRIGDEVTVMISVVANKKE